MNEPAGTDSAARVAARALLPAAAAHGLVRVVLSRLLLPLAIVVPVAGGAGIAWRVAHLRAVAREAKALQAAVAKATDEAEAEVDEVLRSEEAALPGGAKSPAATRPRARRAGPTEAQLRAVAEAFSQVKFPPTNAQLIAQGDEARRSGRWQEAVDLYGRVGRVAGGNGMPFETWAKVKLAEAEVRLDRLDDRRGARSIYKKLRAMGGRYLSPELSNQVDRGLQRTAPQE